MNRFCLALCMLLLSSAVLQSCLKKEYDAPPDTTGYDPQLPVNMTIARMLDSLNGTYNPTGGGDTSLILGDYTIEGIVTANDRSGNLYKQIVIDDSTAAVMLLLDANNLYNEFPVGRKVYVKLKGLYLGYDGGLPVLGYVPTPQLSLSGIPSGRIQDFIIKGNTGNAVPIIEVTMKEVGYKMFPASTQPSAEAKYYNRLITIVDAEFLNPSETFSTPNATTNRDLVSCDSHKVVVRTSNYSNFAQRKLPSGKGRVTGIYTVFQSSASRRTPQLLLRDTSDIQFNEDGCWGPPANAILSEDFNSASSGEISLAGWTNIAVEGSQKFQFSNAGSSSNPYAKISAFNSGEASVVSWLITPGFDLTGAQSPKLTFKSATGFSQNETFKLYISTNYTAGADPATATWTELQATYPEPKNPGYTSFTPSGDISLSGYSGVVHLAWKYVGGNPDMTGTWEIDDVLVSKAN